MPQTIDLIHFPCGPDTAQWPKLSCAQPGQLALADASLRLEANRELLFQGNGQVRAQDDNHRLVFNGTGNLLELHEAGDIRFLTGGPTPAEKLRIRADGNVGLGTDSPQSPLTIAGINNTGVGSAVLELRNISPNGRRFGMGSSSEGLLEIIDLTADSRRCLAIDGDGNIGIGATAPSPDYKLDVQGDLRVTGNLDVNGTVDGRNVSADGENLDTHLSHRDNPHDVTAADVGAPGVATGLVQKSEFALQNVPGASKGDEGRATSLISHGLGPAPVAVIIGLEDFGENPAPPDFERAVDRYYAFRDAGIAGSAYHVVAEVTKPYDGTFKLFTNVGSMAFFDRVRWWALSLGT